MGLTDEQRKAMFAKVKRPKRKRTRNTGKTAKIGSHGLKVYKGTKVYIGKETAGGWSRGGKPAPNQEVVDLFTNMWNNDPSIKKMRKHIKNVKITYQTSGNIAGTWDNDNSKVSIIDKDNPNTDYMGVIVHEVVGHAFWDFSRKWRRDKLIKFNELANSLPPVNNYVDDNKEKWKTINDEYDDEKLFKKSVAHIPEYDASNDLMQEYNDKLEKFQEKRKTNGHETMTRYANEQHSAITELVYDQTHHKTLINDSDKQKLIQAWNELHY